MTEKKIYGSKTRTKLELNWSDTGVTLETPGQCRRVEDTPVSVVKMMAMISATEKHRSKDEEEEDHDKEDSQQHANGTPLTSICTHKKNVQHFSFSVTHPIKPRLTVSSKAWTVALCFSSFQSWNRIWAGAVTFFFFCLTHIHAPWIFHICQIWYLFSWLDLSDQFLSLTPPTDRWNCSPQRRVVTSYIL